MFCRNKVKCFMTIFYNFLFVPICFIGSRISSPLGSINFLERYDEILRRGYVEDITSPGGIPIRFFFLLIRSCCSTQCGIMDPGSIGC